MCSIVIGYLEKVVFAWAFSTPRNSVFFVIFKNVAKRLPSNTCVPKCLTRVPFSIVNFYKLC